MGSRKAKISPKLVASLVPGDTVWDTELKRFGARCRPSGTTYVVKTRIDRKQRWITIGRDGPLTAAEARACAKRMLAEVDSGKDPTRTREVERYTPLFAEFARRWLKEHVAVKRKANTQTSYKHVIDAYLIPALGKVRVDRLDQADALKIHSELARHPYAANRTLAVLSAMMTFAERLKYRPPHSNPCHGVERYREHKRKRPLTRNELAALWAHLDTIEADENPYVISAIRLLLLTGMRREEVLALKWTEVDLHNDLISLPDAKTGPRTVMLSSQARAVLERLPRQADNPFVFVGRRSRSRLINISKKWREIRADLGFPDVRVHDLRHTVGSLLARTAPMIVVRDVLGHSELETTNGYSHAANDDVRKAVEELGLILTGNAA
ncbi:MAG: tyrosine-type recombinase/integrase [Hyphomicrobium zavarzinii]|uniref:tyrosine-type recombinase/integrase n=1 Tax=Hyphomicrobium zavarzinii TaxID=48292 RepID=UPI001A435DFA|nr:site-specific integrase [Hyphomicrobium zavarzinii]MBL8845468.1 tyrosine-type recombinase/integrase [Hyphomicrobium zavarzinii]